MFFHEVSVACAVRLPRLRKAVLPLATTLSLGLCAALTAHADLPPFLQHVVGASSVEAALYRLMHTPAANVLYPRPPKESTAQLTTLLAAAPTAELFALRARAEEQGMDYTAAEADWKRSVSQAKDPVAAQGELADFYERRQQTPQQLAVLAVIAAAPPPASEVYLNPAQQRPWLASVRSLYLIHEQALPASAEDAAWNTFLARYPKQPGLYARYFNVLLDRGDYAAAENLIARLHAAFPAEQAPKIQALEMEARAALSFRRGDPAAALAVYDRDFNPLWPATVLENYFHLLNRTHRAHQFLADAQDRLAANPDDLLAATRIFLFLQQAGKTDTPGPHLQAARDMLARYRISKETRHAAWSPIELYTLAALSRGSDDYPEAARYSYALAAMPGNLPGDSMHGEPAAQAGLAELTAILLTAPDQPIALGAGNLSLYRDIATLDQGPGYWNGILSLWLNGTDPATEYTTETASAQPYFHRAKAAELLARLDREFPSAPERPALHLQLLQATAQYGDPAATIASGKRFLTDFPQAPGRLEVATLTADAYARQKNLTAEFALYDATLAELASRAAGQPLSAAGQPLSAAGQPAPASATPQLDAPGNELPDELVPAPPEPAAGPQAEASVQYAQLLDRYLARLTATDHLPEALSVLRRQLDRNPDDPLLYERLATFLQQNNLSAQQEQVYRLAIAHFPGTSWQDRLGRFYLKGKRSADFAALTRQVTQIFSGTDLDVWFEKVTLNSPAVGPALALQLNLYASKRFPHDAVFTRNLLTAYSSKPTSNPAALDALLRHHWWESPELRDRFFEQLSRTGKLDQELAGLKSNSESEPTPPTLPNPAAMREQAEALLWRSRFEEATPLLAALSTLYPADTDLGDRTVGLYRSLSYQDPRQTAQAVAVERRLLVAEPDSPNRLATLGDLYAESKAEGGEDLPAATPFWRLIPHLHPGTPAGYLTAATIFWDYFQFDDALAEITQARQRFAAPALYGYEAGAIEENRRDLPAAVREYTVAVTRPADPIRRIDSAIAILQAAFAPASDAADSNLQSTATDFFGSDLARERLLTLARRPATAALVDQATAQAVATNPGQLALSLRVDVLVAASREAELTATLTGALTQARTPEQAAAIGDLARTHSLTLVYEAALDRQTALAIDPIERIQLQFALARSQEDRHDVPAATHTVAAVYGANPRLLGVVRTIVDFYNRTNQPKQAVATLLAAAHTATPQLSDALTLEAATDANASGDTAQGRTLAMALLQKSPYNARYSAAAADSYARARDDAGLKAFYLARLDQTRLDQARGAPERKADTATLRRGLIPALTRLGDHAGAEDQYIALMSAYPEDAGTAREAALYALAHGRESQLLGFLRKAVVESPRDSRFSILLAQSETTVADLPAAIAAYSAAIQVRSDRADLYTARAGLELRLAQADPDPASANGHLEAVAQDYARLYTLTYHDPVWMIQLAELRARQNRAADAATALEAAYVTRRGETGDAAVTNLYKVAERLDHWNFLPEARTYAERGRGIAGADFLTGPPSTLARSADALGAEDSAGKDLDTADSGASASESTGSRPSSGGLSSSAALYARIVVRQGHPEEALAAMIEARRKAQAATPSILTTLYRALADGNSPEARKDLAGRRKLSVDTGFARAVTALASAVGTYGTPEARSRFALLLETQHATDPRVAIAAAHAAGLFDREAAWRRQLLLGPDAGDGDVQPYVTLQTSRLQFADLARTLEQYARKLKPEDAKPLLTQAAAAYGSAGDAQSELRLTRALALAADPSLRDRFLELLLRRDPAALQALASGKDTSLADDAANYALAHGSEVQALATVSARGRTLSAVWRATSLAVTGLSFGSVSHTEDAATDAAFHQALALDRTIGERLAHPPDLNEELAGENWFPYAASYAVFRLSAPGHGDPEDLAAAALEDNPAQAAPAYAELAQTYAEAGKTDAALTEYHHALELSPGDVGTLNAQAALLARTGRTPEALATWRNALDLLARQAARRSFPETFWTGFRRILDHLAERRLTGEFSSQIIAILKPYFQQNGSYRSNELLQMVYTASASPVEGVNLLLACTTGVPQEDNILVDLVQTPLDLRPTLPVVRDHLNEVVDVPHARILLRRITLARQHLSFTSDSTYPSVTDPNASTPAHLVQLQTQLIRLYLDRNQLAEAAAIQAAIVPDRSINSTSTLIEIKTRTGQLQPLLTGWAARPGSEPDSSTLASAIDYLQRPTPFYKPQPAQLRTLLDYSFERKRLSDTLTATDFLSLAQNHLDAGDLPGALDLLHRLILQAPIPYAGTAEPDAAGDTFNIGDEEKVGEQDKVDPAANLNAAARLLEKAGHPAEAMPLLTLLVRNAPWNASFRLRLGHAQILAAQPDAGATLEAVARDPQAAYALRVAAAPSLAKTSAHPTSLGSGELDLLARGQAPSPAAARQPLYASARAAVSTADSDRLEPDRLEPDRLLRETIMIDPEGQLVPKARLRLLTLLLDSTHPDQALPVLTAFNASTSMTRDDDAAESTADDAPSSFSPNFPTSSPVQLPSFLQSEPWAVRLHLAMRIAAAEQKSGHPANAISWLQLALDLGSDSPPAEQATLGSEIAGLRAELKLDRQNSLRRPLLRATPGSPLTADSSPTAPVRPRLLLSHASTTSNASTTKEAP